MHYRKSRLGKTGLQSNPLWNTAPHEIASSLTHTNQRFVSRNDDVYRVC